MNIKYIASFVIYLRIQTQLKSACICKLVKRKNKKIIKNEWWETRSCLFVQVYYILKTASLEN